METVERLGAAYDHVWPVNYNCDGQIAVSGDRDELERLYADVAAAGGRSMPLNVSGGFHSPYMDPASAEFGAKKPDAALFEAALRQAGCLPAEAAMVGDRLDNDIAPAKRLGMRTVRILQGYGALSRPRNDWEEPEETVRTLAELPELFPEDKGETE